MDRKDFKFISTKLLKVFLDESFFKETMAFSLKVQYSIKEEETEGEVTVIKVLGELDVNNSDEKTAANIVMESYFETKKEVGEKDLENLNDYLHTPVLNEISILLGNLTGKALKVPIVIPLDINDIIQENQNDEKITDN